MDVAGQVSRHRLVGVHQAVPLEVVRQVDHPVEKVRNEGKRKAAPVEGVVHGLPRGVSKERWIRGG